MADKDKVIKGLEACVDGECGDCPYRETCSDAEDFAELARDALALLKAQEPMAMTLNEYQKLAARTINEDLTEQQLVLHALHGLAAEVGEIHGIFQKVYQGHELHLGHLREEIGDALWFIMELCTAYDWNVEWIARENVQKLEMRYPGAGFDPERSVHREET